MSKLRTNEAGQRVVDLEPGLTITLGLLDALCNYDEGIKIEDRLLWQQLTAKRYIAEMGAFSVATEKLEELALPIWDELGV
jgi:hypothetical protein